MRFLVCAMIALALTACASAPPLSTPSGRPEVTIKATKDHVKQVMMNESVNSGWRIAKETDTTIVTEQKNPDAVSNFFLATAWNPTTVLRVTSTLISVDGGTRVVSEASIISNPGTGMERVTLVTNAEANGSLLASLQKLKAKAEAS